MDPAALKGFLTGLDATDLIQGFTAHGGLGMYLVPGLLQDGHVLPSRPLPDALADPSTGSAVPVIAGSNRDEWKLFLMLDPYYVERRWGWMLRIRDPATYDAFAALMSDLWRVRGVGEPLDALRASGNEALWGYRFDWDESGAGAVGDMRQLLGAAHGLELPFVFGDFSDDWGGLPLFPEEGAASRRALSRTMMDYWAAFARGVESDAADDGSLPAWPRWNGRAEGSVLLFDSEAGGGVRSGLQRIDIHALHARFLSLSDRLDEAVVCNIYAWSFWDTPAWSREHYAQLSPSCTDLSPAALAAEPPIRLQ